MGIIDSWNQVLRRKTVWLVRCCGNTEEWRRQVGIARTQCGPPILFYLRMKVRLSNIRSIILELE